MWATANEPGPVDPATPQLPSEPPAAKPQSVLRRLALNTSTYTLGNLLVTAGAVISFPILTRLLSVDEYGLMGLVTSTLMFLVAIAKIGVQNSAIRFYSQVVAGRLGFTTRQFYSTLLFGMGATGLLATVLWMVASRLTPARWWNDDRVHGLFLLTAVLVLVRVLDSSLINIIRAQQRAAAHATYMVVKRYLGIALTVGSLLFVARSVFGFYYGLIATETLSVLVLIGVVQRFAHFTPSAFSWPLFRQMLAFGLPMVGSELASALLNLGDRYLLQMLLGAQQVGEYTAAYNMCEYAETVIITSVGAAIGPIYMKLYDEKGREATEAFLSKSVRYYFLVGLPLIAGLSAVGREALIFLASDKYAAGAVAVPWVIAGTFLSGLQTITVAGLFVSNRTRLIMILVMAAALFNVGLNLYLIPRMGLEGAAVSTLVSYIVLTEAMQFFSRKILHVRFPWAATARFAAASVLMYVVVRAVHVGPAAVSLLVKIGVGALVYAMLVMAIDPESRDVGTRVLRRLRRW